MKRACKPHTYGPPGKMFFRQNSKLEDLGKRKSLGIQITSDYVYNLQHASVQQKLWEVCPCSSSFIVYPPPSPHIYTHAHTFLLVGSKNTETMLGLDSNASSQAWQIFLCGRFREWAQSSMHLLAGCYVTVVVTSNHISQRRPNICVTVCAWLCLDTWQSSSNKVG